MNRNLFAVCLIGAAGVTFAQDPAKSTSDQTVVVTGARAPESLDNTLWSTTVLTREDIQARQAASLQELLGDVAGITIVNNGGLGKVSNVLMRGTEGEHTLLLIDGVRVASATAGTAPWELIPVSQIERVEIVRGPRSTLYGTDAVGGVVQIFTRRAAQPGFDFGGSIGGGSHDTQKIGADFQARSERVWLSLNAESFDTNGINSCAAGAASAGAACFTNESDLDGYRNHSGSVAVGYQLNDRWTAELRSLQSEGHTEYDGDFGNSTDFAERVYSLSVDGALGGGWNTRVLLGRDADNQDVFSNNAPAGIYDTTRDTASVQFDGALGSMLRLISGVDYQNDKVASDLGYLREMRNSRGAFAELHGAFAGWSALAGARYEDNSQFGGHTVGNIGAARKLSERYRVTASWGTAFHAPTFNDLYYPPFPGSPFPSSNPDLVPEESRSFELGVDGVEPLTQNVPLRWSLHLFQTDIDHLIGLDSNFVPVNINESRIRGAELQGEWRSDAWKIAGQYTRLDPIDRGSGLLLSRRAKQNASFELRHLWPSLSIGGVARYEGTRFDDQANTRPLGGYVTLDLAGELKIGKALAVQARVANLFDRDYSTAAFYLQDGRNYSMTLRYRFTAKQ